MAALVVLGGSAVLLWPEGPTQPDRSAAPRAAGEGQLDGVYASPVPLSADSEYVETDVLGDGDLRVTHWISTSQPVERLRLRPSSPGADDRVVDVEDVVVAVDGVRLDAVVGTEVPVGLEAGQRLYVQYRLAGAVDRSGAAGSRGLARVTSVGIGLDGRALPRTQAFPSARVLTVACLAPGTRSVAEPCGSREEGVWRVTSPAGEVPVAVIAQLDLTVDR